MMKIFRRLSRRCILLYFLLFSVAPSRGEFSVAVLSLLAVTDVLSILIAANAVPHIKTYSPRDTINPILTSWLDPERHAPKELTLQDAVDKVQGARPRIDKAAESANAQERVAQLYSHMLTMQARSVAVDSVAEANNELSSRSECSQEVPKAILRLQSAGARELTVEERLAQPLVEQYDGVAEALARVRINAMVNPATYQRAASRFAELEANVARRNEIITIQNMCRADIALARLYHERLEEFLMRVVSVMNEDSLLRRAEKLTRLLNDFSQPYQYKNNEQTRLGEQAGSTATFTDLNLTYDAQIVLLKALVASCTHESGEFKSGSSTLGYAETNVQLAAAFNYFVDSVAGSGEFNRYVPHVGGYEHLRNKEALRERLAQKVAGIDCEQGITDFAAYARERELSRSQQDYKNHLESIDKVDLSRLRNEYNDAILEVAHSFRLGEYQDLRKKLSALDGLANAEIISRARDNVSDAVQKKLDAVPSGICSSNLWRQLSYADHFSIASSPQAVRQLSEYIANREERLAALYKVFVLRDASYYAKQFFEKIVDAAPRSGDQQMDPYIAVLMGNHRDARQLRDDLFDPYGILKPLGRDPLVPKNVSIRKARYRHLTVMEVCNRLLSYAVHSKELQDTRALGLGYIEKALDASTDHSCRTYTAAAQTCLESLRGNPAYQSPAAEEVVENVILVADPELSSLEKIQAHLQQEMVGYDERFAKAQEIERELKGIEQPQAGETSRLRESIRYYLYKARATAREAVQNLRVARGLVRALAGDPAYRELHDINSIDRKAIEEKIDQIEKCVVSPAEPLLDCGTGSRDDNIPEFGRCVLIYTPGRSMQCGTSAGIRVSDLVPDGTDASNDNSLMPCGTSRSMPSNVLSHDELIERFTMLHLVHVNEAKGLEPGSPDHDEKLKRVRQGILGAVNRFNRGQYSSVTGVYADGESITRHILHGDIDEKIKGKHVVKPDDCCIDFEGSGIVGPHGEMIGRISVKQGLGITARPKSETTVFGPEWTTERVLEEIEEAYKEGTVEVDRYRDREKRFDLVRTKCGLEISIRIDRSDGRIESYYPNKEYIHGGECNGKCRKKT